MTTDSTTQPAPVDRNPRLTPEWRRKLALWVGVLGGPVAWAMHLLTVYALVPWICRTHRSMAAAHVVTVVLLCVASAAGLLAWRNWRAVGGAGPTNRGDPDARSRFLALLGMGTGALFTLIIAGAWVYVFTINPCVE
jgi:hypothetical protein